LFSKAFHFGHVKTILFKRFFFVSKAFHGCINGCHGCLYFDKSEGRFQFNGGLEEIEQVSFL
jgi:hypothetical protein